MANLVTSCRIACSIWMLFFPAFSDWFYILYLPKWLWIWIAVIAAIKMMNVVSGLILNKRWIVEHTFMNKITGLLLFLLPLTLSFLELKYSAVVVCLTATCSAIQEGHLIRRGCEVT